MNNQEHNTIEPAAPEKIQKGQGFLPMLHGKATDEIAKMSNKETRSNPITGTATVTSGDVKLVMKEFRELKGTLGINTHKLLSVGIAILTSQNHAGGDSRLADCKVSIPLREYALHCGYDLNERHTTTPEEAAAEKRRVANLVKDIKKKIKRDLEILRATELSWTENVKGKEEDYLNISIIGSRGIKDGYIQMAFDPAMVDYLLRLPLTQYPLALLAVDARNGNAYSIGLKMAEHYNMDSNIARSRADRLSVSRLLACTSLPTIETVRENRQGWERLIKEPFEHALDTLTDCGLLADWKYTQAKAAPFTSEAANSTLDYETWSKLYIQFVIKDAPDQSARIKSKTEHMSHKKKPKWG